MTIDIPTWFPVALGALALLVVVVALLTLYGASRHPAPPTPSLLDLREPPRRSIIHQLDRGPGQFLRIRLEELTVAQLERAKYDQRPDVVIVSLASNYEPQLVAEQFYPHEVAAMAKAVMELTFDVGVEAT